MFQFPLTCVENIRSLPSTRFFTTTRNSCVDNTYKFPEKLWLILANENGAVASWSQDGTQFYLRTSPEFINIILPQYFKHNKLSSFERQLNLYGFKRTKRQQFDICAYHHPYFQRGREDLISYITRVTKKSIKETYKETGNMCDSDFKSIVSGFRSSEVQSGPGYGSLQRHTFIDTTISEMGSLMHPASCDMSTHSGASTSYESNSTLTKVSDASSFDSYDHYAQNNSVELTDDIDFSLLFDLDIPVNNGINNTINDVIPVLEPKPVCKKACRDTSESIIASNDSRHIEPNDIDLRSKFSHDLSKLASKYDVPSYVWKKCEQEMLAASKLVNTATTSSVNMTTIESSVAPSIVVPKAFNMNTINYDDVINQQHYTHHHLHHSNDCIQSYETNSNTSVRHPFVSSQQLKTRKRKQEYNMNAPPYQNHMYCGMNGYNHRPAPIQIPTTYNNTTRYHTEQRAMSSLMNPNHINPIGCYVHLTDSIPVSPFTPI